MIREVLRCANKLAGLYELQNSSLCQVVARHGLAGALGSRLANDAINELKSKGIFYD